VQEGLEVPCTGQGRILDPYFAFPNGVSEPLVKSLELLVPRLPSELEGVVGEELEVGTVESCDVEAPDSKVDPPDHTQDCTMVLMGLRVPEHTFESRMRRYLSSGFFIRYLFTHFEM